jgi:hypothetical protein
MNDPTKEKLIPYLALHGILIENEKTMIKCPFHHDTNPSMAPLKDNDGIIRNMYCFGCSSAYDIFHFAALFHNLDITTDFPKILDTVYNELNIPSPSPLPKSREDKPYRAESLDTPVPLSLDDFDTTYTEYELKKLGKLSFGISTGISTIEIEKVYPYKNTQGQIVFVECRYRGSSFPDGKKRVLSIWFNGRHLKVKGYPVSLYNRDLLADRTTKHLPVLIHEGAKCADAGTQALPDFIHTAYNGGGKKCSKVDLSPLADREEVYIYPDDDKDESVGLESAKRLQLRIKNELEIEAKIVKPVPEARTLKQSGADIVEALQVMQPEKLNEWIKTQHFGNSVAVPKKHNSRPTFLLDNGYELQDIVPEIVDALNAHFEKKQEAGLYTRNGLILTIEKGDTLIVNKDHLRYIIAEVCTFKNGSKSLSPPIDIVSSIFAHPSRFFRPIDRIITYPVITKSGRAIITKGYDPETKCYYDIPELPQVNSREEAKAILDDMFTDFRFASPSDKAHIIALMLTHIMRDNIDGLVPGFITMAPTQGSGKTLLNRAAFTTLLGKEPSITLMGRDDTELQKHLGAEILTGKPYFFIDNITRKIRSEIITAMLTSGTVGFRILGKSEICYAENNFVFALTANNPQIDKDLLRRLVCVNLDTNRANPEDIDITEYAHSDIINFVKSNRAKILAALLYIARQKSVYQGYIMGSFEKWSVCIGGCLNAAGITGFLDNQKESREKQADEQDGLFNEFVDTWVEAYGENPVSVNDLLPLAEQVNLLPEYVKQKAISLGMIINRKVNNIMSNGYKILKQRAYHNKSIWSLSRVDTERQQE